MPYQYGYHGLLTGNYQSEEGPQERRHPARLRGSLIGNSRVKLTNAKNLRRARPVEEGVNRVAAGAVAQGRRRRPAHHRWRRHQHLTAADLAAYLHENDYELTVVGLTTDNDVVPIRQSLGV